jgi:hypothetical protein
VRTAYLHRTNAAANQLEKLLALKIGVLLDFADIARHTKFKALYLDFPNRYSENTT